MENLNHWSSINLDHTQTINLIENLNLSSSINLDHTHTINLDHTPHNKSYGKSQSFIFNKS
jgi:hypothetical protein